MFIQNAVLKSISAEGLTFPLSEGSVVSAGGVTGIVSGTLDVRPATNRIYVAVAGTIDMTSDANKGVTFTDGQIKALGKDFNFVPAVETDVKKELPDATPAMAGKVLTVGNNGKWQANDPAPQYQIVTFTFDDNSNKWVSDSWADGITCYLPLIFILNDGSMEWASTQFTVVVDGETQKATWKIVFAIIADSSSPYYADYQFVTWYNDGDGEEVVTVDEFSVTVTKE